MALVNQTIKVNMIPGAVAPRIRASQWDIDSRSVALELYSGQAVFSVPASAAVTCDGTRPSGGGFSVACTASGSTVELTVSDQMTAEAGDVRCQITVKDGNVVLGSANFILQVEEAALSPEGVIQTPAFGEIITEAVEDYLDEHGIPTDTTLTQAGAAADAKATGDAIAVVDRKIEEYRVDTDTTLSVAGDAADAKAAGDAIHEVQRVLQNVAQKRTVEIAPEDLVDGQGWTGQGTALNLAGSCRCVTPISLQEGDTIVLLLNSSLDTARSQPSWVALDQASSVLRYGRTPVCTLQGDEALLLVAFDSRVKPASEGRIVTIYGGTDSIPDTDARVDAALTFGNDVVLDDLSYIPGYACSNSGNWMSRSSEIATEIIDIPYNAISLSHNIPGDASDGAYPNLVFFDDHYEVVAVSTTGSAMDVPEGARHLVAQTTAGSGDYSITFRMSSLTVGTVLEETERVAGTVYTTADVELIDSPLGLTEMGYVTTRNGVGTQIKINKQTGWHWQRFDVVPGEVYDYALRNPTAHSNYIVLADAELYAVSVQSGADLTGTLEVPSGAVYLYVSLRPNATTYTLTKRAATLPNVVTQVQADGERAYLAALQAALEAAGVNIGINPPYYYSAYSELRAALGAAGLKFAIFSDTHFKNDGTQPEYGRIVRQLRQMQDDGVIDFVVHLGDLIENQTYSYTAATDALANAGVRYMAIKGNHDLVKQSLIRANCTNLQGMTFDTLGCWAYMDDNTNNVRYVFLNACDKGSDVDNDTATMTMAQSDFSWRQLNWFANTALRTNKTVILFNHASLPTGTTDAERVVMSNVGANYYSAGVIAEAFMAGTSGSVPFTDTWGESGAGASVSYDFSGQGAGRILCLMHGHGHGDWAHVNEYGLLDLMESNALCINNMSASYGYTKLATAGTITEVAFDVVHIDLTGNKLNLYRFGRGIDRAFEL